MTPAEANVALHRLSKLDTPTVALTPEEWAGSGLAVVKRLVTEDKQPIFIYVDRLKLMEFIQTSNRLYKKGTDVCRISNFKISPEDIR